MRLLTFFDKYVALGLKPIAVFKDSKKPACQGWNEDWSIERWREYFLTDEYNMGILLGDIVDVEGDTNEANDLLQRMIDGVPCPKFRSSKSVHYLFQNPLPDLTRKVFDGIEFRGHRHQSVVPPSIHSDGNFYAWLEGSKFPVPPMPDELLSFYHRNNTEKPQAIPRKRIRQKKNKDYSKTQCNCCQKHFMMHKKRLVLEVRSLRTLNLKWMCRSCREIDLRQMCRDIRKQMDRQDQQIYKE